MSSTRHQHQRNGSEVSPSGPAGVVDALQDLGFTQYEARVYVGLLKTPDIGAAELARDTGVPRAKTYEALSVLAARGLSSSVVGKITRYRPLPPAQALLAWVQHRDHERAARGDYEHMLAERVIREFPDVPLAHKGASNFEYMEAVSGRTRIIAALEEAMGQAAERISMISQPPWLQPVTRWNRSEIEARRRGVAVRVIYSTEALQDERRYAPLLDAGVEVRTLEHVPMKLLIVDGRLAQVSLRDSLTGEQHVAATVVRHADLVASLEVLFREQWQAAAPVGALPTAS